MKLAKIFKPILSKKLADAIKKEYLKGTPMKEIELDCDFFGTPGVLSNLQKDFQILKNKIAFEVRK